MGSRRRLDVERELLLAVDQTRAQYEGLCREAAEETEIARDAGVNEADGRLSLERSIVRRQAAQTALEAYNEALRRFSDFVVRGRLPE